MKMQEYNEEKKSMLDSMDKNVSGGFAVPENYFELLSKNISDKVQGIPNLSSVPKASVFETPDGYFAQLENSVGEKISEQVQTVYAPAGQWYRRPKFVLAFASVLILLVAASTFMLTKVNQPITGNDITINDILSSDFVSELDESSLAVLLDESPEAQSSTHLEDYMIDNDIDISTLTDEL